MRPAITRSRLALEVASELVGREGWLDRQARVLLREQGADAWAVRFFASDAPAAIDEVASGRVQIAMVNPAAPLTLAYRGTGPYPEANSSLRIVTVIPSLDWLGLAVIESSGLTSITTLRPQTSAR